MDNNLVNIYQVKGIMFGKEDFSEWTEGYYFNEDDAIDECIRLNGDLAVKRERLEYLKPHYKSSPDKLGCVIYCPTCQEYLELLYETEDVGRYYYQERQVK